MTTKFGRREFIKGVAALAAAFGLSVPEVKAEPPKLAGKPATITIDGDPGTLGGDYEPVELGEEIEITAELAPPSNFELEVNGKRYKVFGLEVTENYSDFVMAHGLADIVPPTASVAFSTFDSISFGLGDAVCLKAGLGDMVLEGSGYCTSIYFGPRFQNVPAKEWIELDIRDLRWFTA